MRQFVYETLDRKSILCILISDDIDVVLMWYCALQEEAMGPAPKVLVTGATGLLGRAVYKEFQNSGWLVIGTGYRRARPHLLRCDLTDEDAIRGLLQEYKVLLSVVLHPTLLHTQYRATQWRWTS